MGLETWSGALGFGFLYLTSIFLSTAVPGAEHPRSDQVPVGADAGVLAHQADIHLLEDVTGLTWETGESVKAEAKV